MIYLIDLPPAFCPSCGEAHTWTLREGQRADFYAGASQQCKCGAQFQYLGTERMADAANLQPSGDLARYLS